MHEIKTETEIDASARQVWAVLVDFATYPEWNPFLCEITGTPAVGEKLKVTARSPKGMDMTFRPTVLAADPERELRWVGGLSIPGLFGGEHYFLLEAIGPDRVRLIHGEQFSGLLVALARYGLDTGIKAGFEAMNQALKSRVEVTGPAG